MSQPSGVNTSAISFLLHILVERSKLIDHKNAEMCPFIIKMIVVVHHSAILVILVKGEPIQTSSYEAAANENYSRQSFEFAVIVDLCCESKATHNWYLRRITTIKFYCSHAGKRKREYTFPKSTGEKYKSDDCFVGLLH